MPDGLCIPRSSPTALVSRRLICTLALLPVALATAIAGVFLVNTTALSLNEDRWFQFVLSIVVVGGVIALWRFAVVWTIGRTGLTAIVATVPFAQVVFAQPLWNTSGCVAPILLVHGQHQISVGLWVWISIWVWWASERVVMKVYGDGSVRCMVEVTPLAKRILASIGILPFGLGLGLVIAIAWEDLFGAGRQEEAIAIAVGVVVGIWCLVWRGAVAWSRRVVIWTIMSLIVWVGLPLAASALTLFVSGGSAIPDDEILAWSAIAGVGLWMGTTAYIWPLRGHAASGLQGPPRCLRCGYLLKGLRATRCPECGDEPTLDELWSGTSGVVL